MSIWQRATVTIGGRNFMRGVGSSTGAPLARLQAIEGHIRGTSRPLSFSTVTAATTTPSPTSTARSTTLSARITGSRSVTILAGARTMATSDIPKTMKGVQVEKTGGVEVLDHKTDLPVPELKDGEALVKNDVSGVNFIDTYFRTGLYPSTKPEILGRDGEGLVVASKTPNFKVGDKVVYLSTSSYAEYTAVPEHALFTVPESLERGVAAAAVLQGLTCITLTEEAYAVQQGDWVLVHAAAGGTGQWLVQVVKAKGAHVIATASTEEKRALARNLGADVVTGYDRDEVLEAVKQSTGGTGVVAVFDGVGKDTFDLSMTALARKGTFVSFGNASGPPEPVVVQKLAAKNVKLCRPTLFNYIVTQEERDGYSKKLWHLLEEKKVKVGIHKVYPLSEIKQAHLDLEGRKTTGKLLLDPSK